MLYKMWLNCEKVLFGRKIALSKEQVGLCHLYYTSLSTLVGHTLQQQQIMSIFHELFITQRVVNKKLQFILFLFHFHQIWRISSQKMSFPNIFSYSALLVIYNVFCEKIA